MGFSATIYAVIWTSSPEDTWFLVGFGGEYYEPSYMDYSSKDNLSLQASIPVAPHFKYVVTPIVINCPFQVQTYEDINFNTKILLTLSIGKNDIYKFVPMLDFMGKFSEKLYKF